MPALSPIRAERVQDWLAARQRRASHRARTPSRTAAEAAALLKCDVAQIASIIFRNAADGTSVLVITSGANRVDEKKVTALTGITLAKADANFVREQTGYAIGGVPPIAHANPAPSSWTKTCSASPSLPRQVARRMRYLRLRRRLGRLSGARVGAVHRLEP